MEWIMEFFTIASIQSKLKLNQGTLVCRAEFFIT